jgi:hypothetical protein
MSVFYIQQKHTCLFYKKYYHTSFQDHTLVTLVPIPPQISLQNNVGITDGKNWKVQISLRVNKLTVWLHGAMSYLWTYRHS